MLDRRAPTRRLSDAGVVVLLWAVATAWAALNLQLAPGLTHPVSMGLTFNEMLTQLLRGRFDLSPSTIGWEAFQRHGHSYAYFGIFCALLRAPLLLFRAIRSTDVTGLSLLVATSVSLACRLAAVVRVFSRAAPSPGLSALRAVVLLAVAFSGESMQFLRPSLYQEVVSWGDALASAFGLVLLSVVLGQGARRTAAYAVLAALAGLALLCRVSFGVGLYAALGLMMATDLWGALRRAERFGLIVRRMAPASVLLVLFAVIAAGVNFARWGDPFSFVPMRFQMITHASYPDRMARLRRYGEFNLERVPFGLQYYFAPIWTLIGKNGAMLLQPGQTRLFDAVELPPGSLLLSDPLTCVFAAVGAGALALRPRLFAEAALARAALAGLAIQALLMLAAISLTFRYRMDLYPALDFASWLGLAAVVQRERALSSAVLATLRVVAVVGVIAACASRLAYMMSPFGPVSGCELSRGLTAFYADELAGKAACRAR